MTTTPRITGTHRDNLAILISNLAALGLNDAEIASHLNLSSNDNVFRIRKKYGIPAGQPRTTRRGATSTQDMKPLEEQFHTGRKNMINAFAELSTLASRAGVDADAITALHGDFFDGNVDIKDAYTATAFLAWYLTLHV